LAVVHFVRRRCAIAHYPASTVSTPYFIAALVGVISAAFLIRASRWAAWLTLALVAVVVTSLILLSVGIGFAAWVALVSTTVLVFTLWPFWGLDDGDL
jgi:hypothetical protein